MSTSDHQPKFVRDLDTPALVVDLDLLKRNIQDMADFFVNTRVRQRPHVKTHKCPQIAQMQLAAGALGITCAKISEAEVMAEAGIRDILIANQVVGPVKIERLTTLAARCDCMVAVDDPANIAELDAACRRKSVRLRILVEVDIGMGRCGVQAGAPALQLAERVLASSNLQFAGLMGYEGHLVMIRDPLERKAKVSAAFAPLAETRDLLESNRIPVGIVSGGGTGTYDLIPEVGVLTECQAGSYIFMDSTYLPIRPEFQPAIRVLTTLVSRPVPGRLIFDAGLKTMTTELGLPKPIGLDHGKIRYLSEEHLVVDLENPETVDLKPGDRVSFIPSHVCTTVNLYDRFHLVQNDELVDIWPIAARGCSQ